MIGPQRLHSQRRLGLGIADGVAFVEDQVVPVKLWEKGQVVSDDFVGWNENEIVEFSDQFSDRRTKLLARLHWAAIDERLKNVAVDKLSKKISKSNNWKKVCSNFKKWIVF